MKKLLSVFAFVIMIFCFAAVAHADDNTVIASGYCGGEGDGKNLTWTLTEDGTLTISGTGAMADYSLYEDFYNDSFYTYETTAPWRKYYPYGNLVIEEGVTSIGNYAFYNHKRFEGNLVIPETVTTIGEGAFDYCFFQGKKLIIGSGVVTIEADAFRNSSFTGNLVIPDSVETIGDRAFLGCEDFTGKLVIGNNVKHIGNYAFEYCGFTGDLVIPDSVEAIGDNAFYRCLGFNGSLIIGNGVKTIGTFAFCDCAYFTGSLEIPSSVKTIRFGAFTRTGFTGDVEIPYNVNIIEPGVFYDTKISNINVSEYNTKYCSIDGIVYTKDCSKTIACPSGRTANIEIPKSVTTIGDMSFYGCSQVTGSIIIPNSVKTIEDYAFLQCGINEYYFDGDAPALVGENGNKSKFDTEKDIIYYPEGNTTWEIIDGKWNGYTAIAYTPCSVGAEHNYESVVTEPTCEEQGYTTHTCSVCGDSYIDTYADATGHSLGDWYETKAPTYTEEGEERRDCKNCEYFETRKVPKLENIDPDATFTVSSETITIGTSKTVSVSISENSDAAMIQFALKYDPAVLKVVSASVGELTSDAVINAENEGIIYFAWESIDGISESGALLNIEFTAVDGIEEQETIVEADFSEDFVFVDSNLKELKIEAVSGTINIIDVLYGDVNGDGKINVIDANLIRRHSTKLLTLEGKDAVAADVSGDGKINVIDANLIRRYATKLITIFPVEE